MLTPPGFPAADIKGEEDLIGPGAKPGTVPTDLEQSTGLERLEILGKMEGVDIFDMRPLDASRKGTVDNPIMVKSAGDEQYAGCTGYPADSHVVNWLGVCLSPPPLPYPGTGLPAKPGRGKPRRRLTGPRADVPRATDGAMPRVRQRLQDGVRRTPGRRPRPPRPPRLRGAQDLRRLRQAPILVERMADDPRAGPSWGSEFSFGRRIAEVRRACRLTKQEEERRNGRGPAVWPRECSLCIEMSFRLHDTWGRLFSVSSTCSPGQYTRHQPSPVRTPLLEAK